MSRVEAVLRIAYAATMRRPLRHVSSQPHLRVLALLAWLMLVLLPAHAVPVAMVDGMSAASMPSAMLQASLRHHRRMTPECCADQLTLTGCHCTASGAFTTPPVQVPALSYVRFKARPASPIGSRAPELPLVPPLRPPQLQTRV